MRHLAHLQYMEGRRFAESSSDQFYEIRGHAMRHEFQSAPASAVALAIVGLLLVNVCTFATDSSTDQKVTWAQNAAKALGSDGSTVSIDDPVSAVRESLGASLEDLSLGNTLGKFSFLMNGGFGLLFTILAVIVTRSTRTAEGPNPSGSRHRGTVLRHAGMPSAGELQ
jgi:hypothetical protein